jgi:hypothetical protein
VALDLLCWQNLFHCYSQANYTKDKFAGYEKLTPAECNEWAGVIVGDE